MKKKLPLVVALMGGPGAGKSTIGAYVFAKLKMLGINCELVAEYAKDKVWEQNSIALYNLVYLFAKQYYRLSRCEDKVDVIITDSPLALTPLYNKEDKDIAEPLNLLAIAIYKKYPTLTYFLERNEKYDPVGRLETEEESDLKSKVLENILMRYNIEYKKLLGRLQSGDLIVDEVVKVLERKESKS